MAENQTHLAIIVVLDSCKNDEVQSKNESTSVLTTLLQLKVYGDFFRHSRAANSIEPCLILLNFEPI